MLERNVKQITKVVDKSKKLEQVVGTFSQQREKDL